MTWRSFLASCVSENDRYLGNVPEGLRVPTVLPAIAKAALALPKIGSRGAEAASTSTPG